ncbi:MAG: hypothetical protein ABL308_12665 [Oceanicaulis sp.]
MDAVVVAAWKEANPHAFIAISLDLAERTVRLTSGGTVTFGGHTYHPEDAAIGVLSEIGEVEEGEVDSAVTPSLTFAPFTDAGLAELAGGQGAAFEIHWGLVAPDTGAVIGAPELVARGRLNVPTLAVAPGVRGLQFSTYSEEQFQLLDDSQSRLTAAHHKSVWGAVNEDGLNNVTRYNKKGFWRANDPAGAITTPGGAVSAGLDLFLS